MLIHCVIGATAFLTGGIAGYWLKSHLVEGLEEVQTKIKSVETRVK